MNRRHFLATGGLALVAVGFASGPAAAKNFVDYKPGLIENALAEGKTVFVDYAATWCGTCARQSRVISDLRAQNPAYDAAMTFVKVDWDTYRRHAVTTDRGVPRRSTLLILRGGDELGRIVAGTSKQQIKALLDAGL